MANVQQITRDYLLRARTEGVEQTTAAAQKLGAATDSLASKTEVTSKSQVSAAAALERHQRSLDLNYRSMKQFEGVQRDLDRAQAQGLLTSARHSELLALAREKYDPLVKLSQAWNQSLAAGNPVLQARSAMQDAVTKQTALGNDAVKAGIATNAQASAAIARVTKAHEENVFAARAAAGQLTASERAMVSFRAATSGVSGQLIALSAGAGPVGVFLSALGPLGLAAAVGIGTLAAAFNHMISEAERLGSKAVEVRKFSDVTGFTISQIKALGRAGAQLGIDSDSVGTALEKFAVGLEEARRGSGNLFDDIRKVDSALALELTTVKSAPQAWDVLSKALANAGDGRAKLARAAFGRGGVEIGLLGAATVDAGGIEKMAEGMAKFTGATDEANRKLAETKVQLDAARKVTANLMAGTYSQEVLDRMLQAELIQQRIVRAIIAAREAQPNGPVGDEFSMHRENAIIKAEVAANPESVSKLGDAAKGAAENIKTLAGAQDASAESAKKMANATKEAQDAAAAASNLEKERIGLLGSGATLDEQRKAKILALTSALLDNKIAQSDYNRAVAAANLDTVIQKESRRLGLLAELAPVDEQVKQKQNEVNKARQEGIRITDAESAAILLRTRRQAELNTVEGQIKFGRETALLSSEDQQIASTLATKYATVTEALNSADAAQLRFNNRLREMKDSAVEFAQTFVSGMLAGKSAADAALASLDKIADKLLNKGIETAITGALSGDPAQMAAGGTQAFIAAGIKLFVGEEQRKKAEAEAQLKAWEAWRAAAKDLESFTAKANGQGVSNIRNQVFDASAEASRLALLRSQAMGYKSVAQENADPVIQKLFADLRAYTARLKKAFTDSFDATISAMQAGFGDNSPLLQGLSEVQSLGEKIKTFIADTEEVFGKGSAQAGLARSAGITQALSTLDTPKQLSDTAAQFLKLQGNAQGLQQVLVDLGMSAADAAKAISEKLNLAVDALRKSFTEDLQRQINDLSGKGFLNDFDKLFKDRQKNIETDKTIGGNSGDLINNLFGLSAQDIINRAHLTGDAFKELLARFPDLAGKVHEFSDVIVRSSDDISKARLSIQDELFGVLNDNNTVQGQIAALDREFNHRKEEEARAGGQLLPDLEALYQAKRRKILEDANAKALDEAKRVADEQARLLEALNQRTQSFRDRLFNALNDSTTLEGQLAAFDRQAQQQREQEAKLGNGALTDLEAALAAERFNIIKNFNAKSLEEAKRAAEAELQAKNQAAKTVLEYLNTLVSGPNATVSPTDNLTNSQALYTSNLALAQGGNLDAINKFPQLADNLEKAARAVYASSQGYQDIKAQIIAQGLALPAVAATTDPLLVAMRDTLAAIQAGTATQATDATLQGIIKTAIDAGNAAQIAALLVPKFDTLNVTTGAGLTFAQVVNALGPIARDTTAGALLTQAQMTALGLTKDTTVNSNLLGIFDKVDVDKNGTLSKAELIRAAASGTKTSVDDTKVKLDDQTALLTTLNSLSDAIRNLNVTLNSLVGGGGDSLKNLITSVGASVQQVKSVIGPAEGANAVQNVLGGVKTDVQGVGNKVFDVYLALADTRGEIADLRNKTAVLQSKVDSVQSAVTSVNNAIGTGQGPGSLQALNSTAKDQLQLLNNQLTGGRVAAPGIPGAIGDGGSGTNGGADLNSLTKNAADNTTIIALNKIVYNTAAIALNTYTAATSTGGGNPGNASVHLGLLAAGGWINGAGTSTSDSIPAWLSNGEFVVNAAAARALHPFMDDINRGHLPAIPLFHGAANDNGQWQAVLAELRSLRAEVAAHRKESGINTMNGAKYVGDRVDENTDAVREDSKEQASAKRQETKRTRIAA